MSFDHLQAICWCITYMFLILYAIKFRSHAIPLVAMCLNFAWETLALSGSVFMRNYTTALIFHIPWFFLDLIMVCLFLFYETNIKENKRPKIVFLCSYFSSILFLLALFLNGYMLLSCFIIDLIMAISFLLYICLKKLEHSWILYFVALFKLLGDMFAWLYYKEYPGINPIGICVLCCNIAYILVIILKHAKAVPIQLKRH